MHARDVSVPACALPGARRVPHGHGRAYHGRRDDRRYEEPERIDEEVPLVAFLSYCQLWNSYACILSGWG